MDPLDYQSTFTLAKDEFGGCRVATRYVGRPPVMFMTAVVGGKYDGRTWSCATYQEALIQHNRIVDVVKSVRVLGH